MTIREQWAAKIRGLIVDMLDLSDDPDISPALKSDLELAMLELDSAEAVIAIHDAGPTQADIEGEVDHA